MVTDYMEWNYGISVRIPSGIALTGPARSQVADIIVRDLQSVFRGSNYWFAFINVPLFFETFFPASRQGTACAPACSADACELPAEQQC